MHCRSLRAGVVAWFTRVYLLPCGKEVTVLITDELICSLWNLGFNRLCISGGVQVRPALKVDDGPCREHASHPSTAISFPLAGPSSPAPCCVPRTSRVHAAVWSCSHVTSQPGVSWSSRIWASMPAGSVGEGAGEQAGLDLRAERHRRLCRACGHASGPQAAQAPSGAQPRLGSLGWQGWGPQSS